MPILAWLGDVHGPHSGFQADGIPTIWNGDGSSGRKKGNVTNCELAHRVCHWEVTHITSTPFPVASKTH